MSIIEGEARVATLPPRATRHWRAEFGMIDTTGRLAAAPAGQELALLTLDVAGESTNALSREVMEELDRLLGDIERRALRGLIVRSAKASGFIVGADVHAFRDVTDAAEAAALARQGQAVLDRLAALPFPSVALIHGFCLGGGLELAAACTWRVARDEPATRLGLPEVRLGIHPGFAGTVRLPPLIGHLPALDLMMTGRQVSVGQARRLGLVDEAVPARHELEAAQSFLARRSAHRPPAWYHRLAGWKPLRPWVAQLLERRTRQARVRPEHYPAPYRILDLWRRQASAAEEADSLGELLVGRTSRNLVRVFLLGEELKRRGRAHAHDITHVHVIGAGVMGADIATWAVSRGFSVSLQDQQPEILARALARAHKFLTRRLKEPRRVQEAMDRLLPDLAGHGLKRADLVLEAIVEKADAKRALFQHVESVARPEALLATNTSSIPLEEIAQALRAPGRLVGLHFFNPATRMQLVEIVRGEASSDEALNRARAWTAALDRLPLDARSSPGFLVNRVLTPYLLESVSLLEDGVAAEAIDEAAVEFGMPMGPIELADTVGLDICLSVAETLAGPLGISVPPELRALVQQNRLGKKTGHGFYRYDSKGRPQRNRRPPSRASAARIPVTERLVLRLLNEAVACLRQGVVADADAVDAGMVYGTGFAPFLGGPMQYARSRGAEDIARRLQELAAEYGERFTPDPGWQRAGEWFASVNGAAAPDSQVTDRAPPESSRS